MKRDGNIQSISEMKVTVDGLLPQRRHTITLIYAALMLCLAALLFQILFVFMFPGGAVRIALV